MAIPPSSRMRAVGVWIKPLPPCTIWEGVTRSWVSASVADDNALPITSASVFFLDSSGALIEVKPYVLLTRRRAYLIA